MASSRRGEAECGDIGSIDTGTGTPAGGMMHGHGAQGTGHGVGVGVGIGVATGCSVRTRPRPFDYTPNSSQLLRHERKHIRVLCEVSDWCQAGAF